MTSRSVARRAARRTTGRSGGEAYPWDGHVHPTTPEDIAASQAIEREVVARYGDRDRLAGRVIAGPKKPRLFFRAGAATLGEPVFRGDVASMTCGRGTGHLGSGLYFFGTYAPALRSADRNADAVYTVVDGPRHPFVTDASFDAAWKLHDFGKALLCIVGDLREYKALHHKRIELDERLKHAATGAEWDDIYEELAEVKNDFRKEADVLARDIRHLAYSGPRLEDFAEVRVYSDPDSVKLPPRIASAVERYRTERRYHPMTYYMRSLGYDGVLHQNTEQFESGTIGNIWYPKV